MGKSIRRRTVYVATIVSMLAMAGGFVLAATVGGFTNAPPTQGGAYGTQGTGPSGVVSTGAQLSMASSALATTCGTATTSTNGVPDALTATTGATADTYCATAVTAGHYVDTITITFTGAAGAAAPDGYEYAITYFIGGVTASPTVIYVQTNSGLTTGGVDTLSIVYDLGSGSVSVTITSVSDLLTQCTTTAGACP